MFRNPERTASSALSRAAGHRGGRQVRQQHALVVLGRAQSVVHQIPIQAIDPRIGMAARGTLPMLKAEPGVVEIHLSKTLRRQFGLRPQGDERYAAPRIFGQIHHGQLVAEIRRDVGLRPDDRQASRAVGLRRRVLPPRATILESNPLPQIDHECQIVRRLDARVLAIRRIWIRRWRQPASSSARPC